MSNSVTTLIDLVTLELASLLAFVAIAFWFGILLAVLIRSCHQARTRLCQRRQRLEQAKQVRFQLREENIRQQLQRPSFQTRLNKFAAGSRCRSNPASRMGYWQSDDLELKYVPPKPIQLIRIALVRLNKLFRGI